MILYPRSSYLVDIHETKLRSRNALLHLLLRLPGDYGGGETPVPIPNTEVKPSSADGTAWVTAWESKSSPGSQYKSPCSTLEQGFFLFGRNGLDILLSMSSLKPLCHTASLSSGEDQRRPLVGATCACLPALWAHPASRGSAPLPFLNAKRYYAPIQAFGGFMASVLVGPGDDVEAWCTRCRMNLNHRVIAVVGNNIQRVVCLTCGSQHKFYPPKNQEPEEKRSEWKGDLNTTKPGSPRAELQTRLTGNGPHS